MDARTLAELRAVLRERRADLRAGLAANRVEADALRSARGDGTADDEHDPEGSTLSGEWDRLEGLRAAAERELAETDRALARGDDYGRCADCGRDIPVERLRARPMAVRCRDCAERAEGARGPVSAR